MKKNLYTPKKLEALAKDIKKKLERKANPSFLDKIKKLF